MNGACKAVGPSPCAARAHIPLTDPRIPEQTHAETPNA